MRRGCALALVFLASVTASLRGRSRVGHVDPLQHRSRPHPPTSVERLARAAEVHGYEIVLAQPARRRFAVRSHFRDRHGGYVLAIECDPGGAISITPVGPRVERYRGEWILPYRVREEMMSLAGALRRASLMPI
ncbi:MAG: hypothetical protein M5U28_04845 [Sandaracinaceae bacterium]|nr:hypothetical protein [Sandaracinaceae bacterium]